MSRPSRQRMILEAAAKLFAEQGFHGTTVRQIADASDLTSGSLFHHYDSKRQMLIDVVEEGTLRTDGMVAQRLVGRDDPVDRLRELLTAHLEALHEDTWWPFMVVSATEWHALTDEERAPIVATRDAYEDLWREVLAGAAAAGLVSDDPLLRLFLLGAANWTLFWYDATAGMTPAELAEQFCSLVVSTDRYARPEPATT